MFIIFFFTCQPLINGSNVSFGNIEQISFLKVFKEFYDTPIVTKTVKLKLKLTDFSNSINLKQIKVTTFKSDIELLNILDFKFCVSTTFRLPMSYRDQRIKLTNLVKFYV